MNCDGLDGLGGHDRHRRNPICGEKSACGARGEDRFRLWADLSLCPQSRWSIGPFSAFRLMVSVVHKRCGAKKREKKKKRAKEGRKLQGSAKRLLPGCENAAGKLRQKW